MLRITAILLFVSFSGLCQTLTPQKQRALNNYVTYANQTSNEVSTLFERVVRYTQRLKYFKNHTERSQFTCPEQIDDYNFKQATTGGAALANAATLNARTRELRAVAEQLDAKCKALDTYHKLEDQERDNFKQADILISEMTQLIAEYKKKYAALALEIETTASKLQPASANPYWVTQEAMRKEIREEKSMLDSWNYNLNEDIHTGFPVDKLQSSILETDKSLQIFKTFKPAVKYPASSMVTSFAEGIQDILNSKRKALDGYNFEAKKSDAFTNQFYTFLINYYNGILVADHNTFVEFSMRDGYYGVLALKYFPVFELRTNPEVASFDVKPFQDKEVAPLKIARQNIFMPKATFGALGNYVEFINESVAQSDYLLRALRNYNSSAWYYKDLTSFKGKGGLTYNPEKFEIPLSVYQEAVAKSVSIPVAYRKSLNDQAEVILNILKEMDALSIALATDASTKAYEKDNLNSAYSILERYAVLFDILDVKKERLYMDVRSIAESYARANPTGAWSVSNKALLTLTDEDKVQLFKAKAYFKGNRASLPNTDRIDSLVRTVISNEFTNMKGIERLGSYNGNDPYSPYEVLATNSRTLGEKIATIEKAQPKDYQKKYQDYIYMYNVVVHDYNKFVELAKIDLLKTIYEPEMFMVRYPEKKPDEKPEEKTETHTEVLIPVAAAAGNPPQKTKTPSTPSKNENLLVPVPDSKSIKTHTETHDTVYIEKHDTVYLGSPGDPTSFNDYAFNNIVFLLDVSGSMAEENRLPLLKKSMIVLVNMLRPEDRLSIVVYSGKARVMLHPTSGEEKEKLISTIEALDSEGQTDVRAGLQMAYKLADEHYIRGGNNRLILATDGDFSIDNPMLKTITRYAKQDIYLSTFAYGNGTTVLKNLEKLAATGNGHYENITPANADISLIREAKAKKK